MLTQVYRLVVQHANTMVICTSPNASIKSELLVDMLAKIDDAGVFPRSDDEGIPLLLIDRHHSRTQLSFLNYINFPLQKWKVCIGVPYATHMGEPHNSSKLNATLKTKLYKEKKTYLREKPLSMKFFVLSAV
jgi:hypothetical protein